MPTATKAKSSSARIGSRPHESPDGNGRSAAKPKSPSLTPKNAGRPAQKPRSAAVRSPFPPIADYAFISNCHTGALIAPDGSVDWLCVPRFDSPSVFGTLLDRQAGCFRFAPFGVDVPEQRSYQPGTNVLITVWNTPTGWVRMLDALTIGPRRHQDLVTPHTRPPADSDAYHQLVRTAVCVEGEVELELTCEPVFDYGRAPAQWSVGEEGHRADASAGELTIRLQSDMAVGVEGDWVRARHVLKEGETAYCALSWAEELEAPKSVQEANADIEATSRYWRSWLKGARLPDHRWRQAINRSAIGAQVTCKSASRTQTRSVTNSVGYASASDLTVHFGLGTDRSAALEIRWPSGTLQELSQVAADQRLEVEEPG